MISCGKFVFWAVFIPYTQADKQGRRFRDGVCGSGTDYYVMRELESGVQWLSCLRFQVVLPRPSSVVFLLWSVSVPCPRVGIATDGLPPVVETVFFFCASECYCVCVCFFHERTRK
ncbi:unnamed protein product [Ectocarpus sp. 12 AP-2014]